jgi:ribosome maturation factor RimP
MLFSNDSFRADATRRQQDPKVGARPLFLRKESVLMSALQSDIEGRLATSEPEVEVLLAEVVGGRSVRVYIDHPDGVTLELCERVSEALAYLRERYSLEVSSPGAERPLTKPAHFRRFVGRRARVRLRQPRRHAETAQAAAARTSFTGELVGASDAEVTLAADEGLIAIPYSEIRRSNLIGE